LLTPFILLKTSPEFHHSPLKPYLFKIIEIFMRKFLLPLLILAFTTKIASAQNVMSHLDLLYAHNAGAAVGSNNNPTVPAPGVMSKWVHDPTLKTPARITWDQSRFKSYFFNGMPFRLRFPKNYDPSGVTRYPLVLFLHGAGEAAPSIAGVCNPSANPNRENQDQLFWGAQTFDTRIENGEWNGFLLFPQQNCNQAGGWDNSLFEPINQVLDTLQKYHKFDQNRLIVMGLSSGGGGAVAYASQYPKRVAVAAPSDPSFGLTDVNAMLHIPTWIANGGQDPRPTPGQVHNFINGMRDLGGDTYQNYYATTGHFSWNKMWNQTDVTGKLILTDYWNRAHKAQPIVFFGNTQFCADAPISVKMGITPGYGAYQWQKNTNGTYVTISGATGNEYTATEIGSYRVRFQAVAGGAWSAYSPRPIVISIKPCATDTLFAEHFDHFGGAPGYLYFGPSWGYRNYNYFRQSGLFVPGSETFTQDALGKQGGRFLFNHTYPSSTTGGPDATTPYAAGDQVWRYYDGIPVTPNTNYIFSFYAGNITTVSPVVQIVPKMNGVTLTPTNLTPVGNGNGSWTKYNYIWNSGPNTMAYPELLNNSIVNTTQPNYNNGNDFAVDEISLTKLLSPGGIATGMALWVKPENLTGNTTNGIATWPNAAGGKNLIQNVQANKPFQSSASSDFINFNPVAVLSASGVDYMTATGGFSGNSTHTAAHVYVVARSNNTTQTHFFLQENQNNPSVNKMEIALPSSGNVKWTAGNVSTNLVQASFASGDVNKPILWSFNKSDAGTANGFKQDIRKNGSTIASNNNTGSFSGNNSSLQLGEFDGKVAEVIYYLDANITAAQQNKIESYLALKYGLTLGTGSFIPNYTASDGSIFWSANPVYHNDIFGIGTDNASGLRQAISNSMNTGSGNGTGQSRKGNLVLKANGPLADRSFLVIGHTTGTLTEQSTDLPANTAGANRLTREWKVVNTGGVSNVNMSFDTIGLTLSGGANLNNFRLLIDNDGDGNFTTGTVTNITASGVTGKKINFNNINLPNNAVFTFSSLAPINGFGVAPVSEIIVSGANSSEQLTDSKMVSVKINPNPVKGNTMFVQINSPQNNQATISIVDANGSSVLQLSRIINSGTTILPITTNNLASGVYLLRVQLNDKVITQKFVKSK
jgi:predicted esterase